MEGRRPLLLRLLRLTYPRARRVAVGLWIAFAVILWNVVFDHQVETAAKLYVYRQGLHEEGGGPLVTIDEVMRPAVAGGVLRASEWSLLAMGIGLAGVAATKRHNP